MNNVKLPHNNNYTEHCSVWSYQTYRYYNYYYRQYYTTAGMKKKEDF